MKYSLKIVLVFLALSVSVAAQAQKYPGGIIDKTVAKVGNEMISISDIEEEVQVERSQGMSSDRNLRCEILEASVVSKLLLMQARLDSLNFNADAVESQLTQRLDQVRTGLGGDEAVEAYFGKPVYKLRAEWRQQIQEMSLTQAEQTQISSKVTDVTPYDVRMFIDTTLTEDLPIIPIKYRLSHICVYPDREAANLAVRERLLEIRERIINGEKFATLARIYSEDPGSARNGGELGLASKSIFWPAFSDAAMALKPGLISQIVETPDGFHLIEVLEKKGDMFNARHILLKPKYTEEDRERAFSTLDSLKTEIEAGNITFEMAARYYSEDFASSTNGGQMADPYTGSSYFEIDQLKPQDYVAVQDLEVGQISSPLSSLDNEGRDGNLVFKIIRLDQILPAHPATFEEDYTLIADMLLEEGRIKAVDDFIREKIEQTKIHIDPLFKDCEFEHEGLKSKISE